MKLFWAIFFVLGGPILLWMCVRAVQTGRLPTRSGGHLERAKSPIWFWIGLCLYVWGGVCLFFAGTFLLHRQLGL